MNRLAVFISLVTSCPQIVAVPLVIGKSPDKDSLFSQSNEKDKIFQKCDDINKKYIPTYAIYSHASMDTLICIFLKFANVKQMLDVINKR